VPAERRLAPKREFFRIAIDRTGHVRHGAETIPCHVVVNLTEKGVQLQLTGPFATGDRLHFEVALTERESIACTVKVIIRPPLIGAVIESISSQDQTVLSRFIDEVNTMNLMRF